MRGTGCAPERSEPLPHGSASSPLGNLLLSRRPPKWGRCKSTIWPTDGVIFETQGPHFIGREQIAAVENDGTRHDIVNPFPINVVEFWPVRREDQSFGL